MTGKDDEEERLRSVALQNAQSILVVRRRAEEALRKQSEWLRITLASIGDAVISTDTEGRVTFMNGVAENLTGWSQADAVGRDLDEVFHIVNEWARKRAPSPVRKVLDSGQVVGLANHTVLISRDSTERPIDDSAAPIRDESGTLFGVVLVFRDITERRQAEKEAAERARLAALGADAGLALTRGDTLPGILHDCAKALVAHLNAAFARIWTVNEAGDVLELQASAGLYTHLDGPHSRVPIGQFKIGLIARERKPHLTNTVLGDPRVSDQEWARREGMVAFAGYPLVVEDRLVGVVALFARQALPEGALPALASVADLVAVGIDRKRAEEAERRQREWLHVTLSSVGDAMIATDARGQVIFLNAVAESLTGWRQDEAKGRPLEEVFRIINEQTRRPTETPVRKVIEQGIIAGLANHTILIARDGSERPIADSAAPIRSGPGAIQGVVLVFRDVSEARKAEKERERLLDEARQARARAEASEAQLAEAGRRKDNFLALLGHELRNPLAPIRNAAAILGHARGNGQALEQARSMIDRQVRHLTRLVDELLDASRIANGKVQLRRERLDLAKLVRATVEDHRHGLEPAGLVLKLSVPTGPVWVEGDAVRLTQIVSNLLHNATKFTDSGGQVSVRVAADGSSRRVEVFVQDTGIGMAPAMLDHLFEAFSQADRSLDRSRGGLGLGLALVKGLVQLHGGEVRASSAGLGQGSQLTFWLPLAEEQVAPATPASPSAPATGRRLRVLIIEDNRDAADSLRMVLELTGGHTVAVAYSGSEGVELARALQPEVVLCDLGLPGLSGFEVARALRADRNTASAKLIAISGYGQAEDQRKAREAGFDAALVKPVDLDALQRLLAPLPD